MGELEFLRPKSVADALKMLVDYGDEAKLVAAGSAVVLMLTQRLIAPRYLISLERLQELYSLNHDPGIGLHLGAMVTHYQMESSPAVRTAFPALANTFHKVANIRIRHQATVGGVLCEADYASDPPAMLIALGALVKAVSLRGERWLDLSELFQDFYQTNLAPDEILTDIFVPEMEAGTGATYLKFNTRSSEDRPCVGVAAVIEHNKGICKKLRVVVGAVAGTPQEFPEIEAQANGKALSEELAREIGHAYAESIDPISDMRGSGSYRRQVIEVLVRRAILQAGGVN